MMEERRQQHCINAKKILLQQPGHKFIINCDAVEESDKSFD